MIKWAVRPSAGGQHKDDHGDYREQGQDDQAKRPVPLPDENVGVDLRQGVPGIQERNNLQSFLVDEFPSVHPDHPVVPMDESMSPDCEREPGHGPEPRLKFFFAHDWWGSGASAKTYRWAAPLQ